MTCRLASLLLILGIVLTACGPSWAPVQDGSGEGSGDGGYAITSDGHYRVKRGDTLHAIAFNYGLDWRDVADWNAIRAPYTIYPDQELRLSPPASRASSSGQVVTRAAPQPAGSVSRDAVPTPPASTADAGPAPTVQSTAPATRAAEPVNEPVDERVDERLGGQAAAAGAVAAEPTAPAATTGAVAGTAQPSPGKAPPLSDPDRWLWPADGRLLSRFQANDPARNGIDIGGEEGQPVRAAAYGEVVYSGSGLIGYGELIIVKHSDRMLSAYAHNRRRLVAEGQRVNAGEQLAEMGRNDRNQSMLHFEIRVNGTPQDPLKYLPRR
ncbi:MAG: peptidoglycan DD-metalloendopeptidase family protein [Lysobacterales bacterium]